MTDLPPHSRDALMFRVGYLQSTCDQMQSTCDKILARVTGSTATPSIWVRVHELSRKADLAHKLYKVLVWSRLVSWPTYAYLGLRWLGWL